MRFTSCRFRAASLVALTIVLGSASLAVAFEQPGWDGKRHISYQQQKDLFYNYYAQPGPYNGAAAGMYVCPRPVPANVGHTWVTYQPLHAARISCTGTNGRTTPTTQAPAGDARMSATAPAACGSKKTWPTFTSP